jgi:tetratricopeptide (TPR) repeat protein
LTDAKLSTIALITVIYLGSFNSGVGQDVAQLAMRARINLYDNWNFDSVAYYFDQVIGEKYAPAFAYSDYGWYLMLSEKFEEGLTYIRRAAKMDPNDKQLVTWYAWALLWSEDLGQAKLWLDRALALDPDYGEALFVGSLIASGMKNHQEAILLAHQAAVKDTSQRAGIPLALAEASRREEATTIAEEIGETLNVYDAFMLMQVYLSLGDRQRAMEYLKKAFELRHPFMPWLKFIPGIEELYDYPEFQTIVQKMNLPK